MSHRFFAGAAALAAAVVASAAALVAPLHQLFQPPLLAHAHAVARAPAPRRR